MNRHFHRTLKKLSQHDGLDVTLEEAFGLALHHHRAGRLSDAEGCYRQILEVEPYHLDALNNLGSAVRRQGRLDEAIEIYEQALAIKPHSPEAWNNLGSAYQAKGQIVEAIESYRRAASITPGAAAVHLNLGVALLLANEPAAAAESLVLTLQIKPDQVDALVSLGAALQALDQLNEAAAAYLRALRIRPNHVLALVNLGNVRQSEGRVGDAMACFEKALHVDPNCAEAHFNLGNALFAQGDFEAATALYRRAVGLRPDYAKAHLNLGGALLELGETEAAVTSFEEALALNPHLAMAHMNIGNALQAEERFDEALARYRAALEIAPAYAEAHMNLGHTLQALERRDDALAHYRAAVALAPGLAPAHLNLGLALRVRGELEAAEAHYRRAVQLRPDYAEAHVGLAMVQALLGKLEEAWPHYEWRWRIPDWPTKPRAFDAAQWDGGELAGKTILLHAEQGLGDTIQFARFVPLVAGRAKNVIVQAPGELLPALASLGEVAAIVDTDGPLPPFDVHCPFMTVPTLLGGAFDPSPSPAPYLRAAPDAHERWRRRLSAGGSRFKVGLVWGGNPDHRDDKSRSVALDALCPLFEASHVAFYSLQVGERAEEIAAAGLAGVVTDLSPDLKDLGETAAALAALDLVITVDTAVAHLAGALGRPTWLLLPFAPDWRWAVGSDDTPWYPTMRLFRQTIPGDWGGVVARVTSKLADAAREHAGAIT